MSVIALTGLARGARADVDLSGTWLVVGYAEPPGIGFECAPTVTQTGATLSAATPPCFFFPPSMAGTIDPVAGTFTFRGFESQICAGPLTVTASASPDGVRFEGVVDCSDRAIPDMRVIGSRCGNGALDPGEACDDGNRADGDCCSRECTPEAAGNACGSGNPCVDATCDGAGACIATPVEGVCNDFNDCTADDACVAGECLGTNVPDGTSCDDHNACTEGDRCEAGACVDPAPMECGPCRECHPVQGCLEPELASPCENLSVDHARLRLRDRGDDRGGAVRWKIAPPGAGSVMQLADPRTTATYDLCVFEGFADSRLLVGLEMTAAAACDGDGCWKARPHDYMHRSRSRTADRSMTLAVSQPPEDTLTVLAKGAGIGVDSLPVEGPTVVQLQRSDGACFQAAFPNAQRDDARGYDARIAPARTDEAAAR